VDPLDLWLLPLCGLGVFLYLMVQQQGVMEARYRKPLDPIFLAAAVVMTYRLTRRSPSAVPAPAVVEAIPATDTH
jgi:hypothetical protein